MEYQVPQFTDVEDKIFGPLTIKQFIYLAGGAGICAILLLSLPFFFGILLAIPVAALALALAFYKVNGRDFVEVMESGFTYYVGGRTYLWRKEKKPVNPAAVEAAPAAPIAPVVPKEGLTRRKLDDLAWSLDVRDTGKNPE
jgi:hypothetical protein